MRVLRRYTAESIDPGVNADCTHSNKDKSQMFAGVSGYFDQCERSNREQLCFC